MESLPSQCTIVKEIRFDDLKTFWIDNDHFENPLTKRYPLLIKQLGIHKCTYETPAYKCYGLFYEDKYGELMIGGTMLTQWQPNRIRYRTLHIVKEHRGNDLGWHLLETAWNMHWKGMGHLWGHIKDTHYRWALSHGFWETDTRWTDEHIGMYKVMD